METNAQRTIQSLRDARTWKGLVGQQKDLESMDKRFVGILDGYIQELRYRLRFDMTIYKDDLGRLRVLKSLCHQMDPLIDEVAQMADDFSELPLAVRALTNYLGMIATDIGGIIWTIEQQRPELAAMFATQREHYAVSLLGEDALKAWFAEDD